MIRLNDERIMVNNKFPDGTFAFRVDSSDVTKAVIRWDYECEEEMAALYHIVYHLRSNICIKSISLVLPYCPNSRMDRTRHDYEVFSLKSFANFINMLEFDYVSILDPHSNVTPALINNCKIISPEPYIRKAIEAINDPNLLLFYPDEGAMKRYSDMIKTPYGFGIKRRCWETGKITGFDVVCDSEIKGKNVLIVDDICCRGGTFFHSAKALKNMGAKTVSAFCSHCEHSVFDGDLLTTDFVDHIYTTDSIFHDEHEKITVFPVFERKEDVYEAQPSSAV